MRADQARYFSSAASTLVPDVQESILDRLAVSNVFRLEPELFDVLGELRGSDSLRVLVIDNVAPLFRDALMGTTAQGELS